MKVIPFIGEVACITVVFVAALALMGHSIERADAEYRADRELAAVNAQTSCSTESPNSSDLFENCLHQRGYLSTVGDVLQRRSIFNFSH